MLEEMVKEARNVAPQVDEGAQRNAEFAGLIAASLADKLGPLKALSDFAVVTKGDTAIAIFKRPVGSKKAVTVAVAIDYNSDGFAQIKCAVGDVNAEPVIYDICESSVDSVVDNMLSRHRAEFKTLIGAWV